VQNSRLFEVNTFIVTIVIFNNTNDMPITLLDRVEL